MKRRDFIKVTGMGVAGAATIAAPAIAQSMPEIKWRMTTSWPKSLDTLYGGAEMMAKVVGEATDNKFQIQTFAAGEIVPGLQVLDAVQNGTVEMGHTASYYYFGKDPTFHLRFVQYRSDPIRASTRPGTCSVAARRCSTNSTRATTSPRCLPATPGVRWVAGSARRLPTVDDLKGLKFRIGGFAGRVLQKLGACRSRLAGGDIYPGAWKKARSTRRSGSVPMTMRSSASTRSRPTTTIPDGGRAVRCFWRSSISTSGMRCRNSIRVRSSRPVTMPTTG